MENNNIAVLLEGAAGAAGSDMRIDLSDSRGIVEVQSASMDLIVRCARTDLSMGRAEAVQRLASEVTNWPYLLRLASFHGVLPLVAKGLMSAGINNEQVALPPFLASVCRDTAVRNLTFAGEQQRILRAFDARKIPGIPFKGPVLAQQAYGNLGLRSCTDIDLLIPADRYREAEAVLLSEGFRIVGRAGELNGMRRSLYLTLSRQCPLARGSVVLDLHVGIMPPGYRYAPLFAELMARSVTVDVGSIALRTFSPEDLLLILCFHGVKNRWEALKHVCDVAELIRSHPQLDWDAAIDRARRTCATRILRLGLHLANKLLDAPLPAGIAAWCARDTRVEHLGSQLIQWLARSHEQRMSPGERFRFHLAVQDTAATKARYFAYALARRAQRSAAWVPED